MNMSERERETIFNVHDSQLGCVKLEKRGEDYFLYVGSRDIQVDAGLSRPKIIASGTHLGGWVRRD